MIDGSFTSNTAVYIGKQGRRNLYEGNTTHESSGGKTSHVSDHPTSEGDQPGLSVGIVKHHWSPQPPDEHSALGVFWSKMQTSGWFQW